MNRDDFPNSSVVFPLAPGGTLIAGGRVGALHTERLKIGAHFVVRYDIVQI